MKKTCVSSFLGIILLAASAFAQDKKPAPAPKPPVLTDSQKLPYFKVLSEYQNAASQAEKANQAAQAKQAALQSAVQKLSDICGKDFTIGADAAGDLVCNAKPKKD